MAFFMSIEWNLVRLVGGPAVTRTVQQRLPGSIFVCLKLGLVQLFPARSRSDLLQYTTSFAFFHLHFCCQCFQLFRI